VVRRDIDAMMDRTRGGPIPPAASRPQEALAFGVVTLAVGLGHAVMGLALNWTAAACSRWPSFYVFVYTIWLKRRTPQNIVIGGAAGAFPPMIGWAAVTGDVDLLPIAAVRHHLLLDAAALLGAGALPPGDYARAGVPMLPVVAGEAERWRSANTKQGEQTAGDGGSASPWGWSVPPTLRCRSTTCSAG
jgi:heme o synthase